MRTLGQGRSGTVYLALHVELKEYRAIKRVPKASADYEKFKKEALLLTSLNHEGIPAVYDLEEDCSYSYLIEEYLEGDTLYDLVARQGHLNQETVIRIGIQVCELVHYLHSAGQTPILYLDLQPKNLLFCHGHVKLLDFDHADYLYEANHAGSRYGTPGFCAPEQRAGGALGVYTDVYQIGALLYYLSTGQTKKENSTGDGELGRIIEVCVREDRTQRYPSIEELKQELETLYSQTGVFKENQSSSLILALAGSRHGVGTTHLAIGLAQYLDHLGYKTLYEERNRSGDVGAMAARTGSLLDSYGIYRIGQMAMKPWYGQAVQLKQAVYPVVIRDYGTEWKTVEDREGITALWLVRGGKWWEQDAGALAAEALKDSPGFAMLYNRTIPAMKQELPRGILQKRCFQVPYYPDPWKPGKEAELFFEMLVKEIPGSETGRKFPEGMHRKKGWADRVGKAAGRRRRP